MLVVKVMPLLPGSSPLFVALTKDLHIQGAQHDSLAHAKLGGWCVPHLSRSRLQHCKGNNHG